MTFKDNIQLESGRASSGGGRGMAIGGAGGIGGLLLVGLFLLLGGSPEQAGQVLQNQQQWSNETSQDDGTDPFAHCQTGADANQYEDCLVYGAALSVDDYWAEQLPAQAQLEYQEPGLVIFQDAVQSGCGMASASTGPFYCGADQSAYFDTSFFGQLKNFGGSDAPLAQMYIVAHEFGHHIQYLQGTIQLVDYNDPGKDSMAVKMEMQADCYAGMWVSQADKGEDAMLEPITQEQVQTAIDTARAVGDDNIQRRSGGEVQPDLWTHGSSEQRQEAFMTGYRTGSMQACDYPELGVGGRRA
ncbi:KPN_02809 family neutral zinc metallopeptidase [Corynebacterium guangdongense]|uniref:Metalloprotease n=1 Tax=Corynebacterium guangdongense TaxID=1783348 RepID=A0ABU1ZYV8_9CORY|nr:neutral zinc metallopeptidase [Corynebacterium guangdongense]MDR7329442.1 putative metalloprotease [Corynebacterium guangdongense]WJZ18007.1 Putative neutral zinc metallopeptidase [Corynebacterium guangdongense]